MKEPVVLFEATLRDSRSWSFVASALVAAPIYERFQRTQSAPIVTTLDLIFADKEPGDKFLIALESKPEELCAVLVENEGEGPHTDIAHDLNMVRYHVYQGTLSIRMIISSVEHIPNPEWSLKASRGGAGAAG